MDQPTQPHNSNQYQANHDWIEVVTRKDRGKRSVGPGVIEAFYAGYKLMNPTITITFANSISICAFHRATSKF